MDVIDLGGIIELHNFNTISSSELTIVKKIVGQYVKSLTTNGHEVSLLTITRDENTITATLEMDDISKEASSTDANLYFALSNCLEQL